MRRTFTILASIAAALMVASLASAWSASGDVEVVLIWAAMLATTSTHGLAAFATDRGRRRIEGLVARLGLPAWVDAQAERNRGKVLAVGGGVGNLLAVLTVVPIELHAGPGWRLGLPAMNLAFQSGAFAGEFLMIAAQSRLARDLSAWPRAAADL